jgi:hypothetical protein
MKALLVTLLALSAFFELVGTITVAYNYYRTGRVAKGLIEGFNPGFSIHFEDRKKPIILANELTPKWYLTLGLVAYVLGAILGLLAGLAAVYHW